MTFSWNESYFAIETVWRLVWSRLHEMSASCGFALPEWEVSAIELTNVCDGWMRKVRGTDSSGARPGASGSRAPSKICIPSLRRLTSPSGKGSRNHSAPSILLVHRLPHLLEKLSAGRNYVARQRPPSTTMTAPFIPRTVFPTLTSLPRSYYLGHHAAGLAKMHTMLNQIDFIIECRDYRIPLTSRNPMFEDVLAERERMIVYTKKDLGCDGKAGREEEREVCCLHIQ